jgi:ATP-dependent DNA helicase RecG
MEQYDSGFQLAEVDLQLRGPGELFGIRQSGLPEARVSTLLQPQVILRARQAAERTLGLTSTHVEA